MNGGPKMVVPTAWQMGLLLLATSMEQGIRKTRKMTGRYAGPGPAACALGAAWINGGPVSERYFANSFALKMRFPVLQTFTQASEAEREISGVSGDGPLFSAIVVRNDKRDWSRTKIVRWLRRLARLPDPPKFWDDVA